MANRVRGTDRRRGRARRPRAAAGRHDRHSSREGAGAIRPDAARSQSAEGPLDDHRGGRRRRDVAVTSSRLEWTLGIVAVASLAIAMYDRVAGGFYFMPWGVR